MEPAVSAANSIESTSTTSTAYPLSLSAFPVSARRDRAPRRRPARPVTSVVADRRSLRLCGPTLERVERWAGLPGVKPRALDGAPAVSSRSASSPTAGPDVNVIFATSCPFVWRRGAVGRRRVAVLHLHGLWLVPSFSSAGNGQQPHERRRSSLVPIHGYTDEGKAAGLAATDLSLERLTGPVQ